MCVINAFVGSLTELRVEMGNPSSCLLLLEPAGPLMAGFFFGLLVSCLKHNCFCDMVWLGTGKAIAA